MGPRNSFLRSKINFRDVPDTDFAGYPATGNPATGYPAHWSSRNFLLLIKEIFEEKKMYSN